MPNGFPVYEDQYSEGCPSGVCLDTRSFDPGPNVELSGPWGNRWNRRRHRRPTDAQFARLLEHWNSRHPFRLMTLPDLIARWNARHPGAATAPVLAAGTV